MNPQIGFLLNKSLESLGNSNLESAELYLKQALRLQPSNPNILRLLGVISAQRRQYSEAIKYLNDSLRILPKNSLALSNLGNIFLELKEYSKALDFYDRSINIDPKYEEAWSNKGNALHELKRFEDAISHHDKALNLKPHYAEAWSNKGNALYELKRFEDAISHHDKALNLKPHYAEAWSNKGIALIQLKLYDDAIAHFERALNIKPNYAEAWANKGIALIQLKRYDDAIAHFERALNIMPNYAEACAGIGDAMKELGRYEEAIVYFDKALSLKPDIDWAYVHLIHIKMKMCNWFGLDESLDKIISKVNVHKKSINPFPLLALTDDALFSKRCAEIYLQTKYPIAPSLGPIPKYPNNKKILIGYFSADFRNHAVSVLAAELFELHDKNKFDIVAFSYRADDNSHMYSRLRHAFNQFIDVSNMSDKAVAQLARELGIDIAVDLGGFTAEARPGIFAHRAAPIQVSYLGYLGTMGADYMDYLVADKTIIPDGSEQFYSEKIVFLPSYQVNDRKRKISEKKFTKQELGIPENSFVFCCFNNNYKILPETFSGWMRILCAVENSILFLYADNEWSKVNLLKEAELRGVDGRRLVFGERIPADEYLARYQVCDLFLDTFPYNAGTTASDALWAGLPLVTLQGKSFAGRMASSLLNAIGLPELITNSQEGYEALAIDLAMNPLKYADVKFKLSNNRLTTPLFDTHLFTKNIETAYIKMYEQIQSGLEPDHHIFIT